MIGLRDHSLSYIGFLSCNQAVGHRIGQSVIRQFAIGQLDTTATIETAF